MKKSILVCLIALCILISGCSSLLNASYTYESEHKDVSAVDKSESEISVFNYDDLKTAIYNFVKDGVKNGTIRFYYNGDDTNAVISKAIQEVKLNTAEGAYAVDLISPKTTRIVSYYEIQLSISYLKTRNQMNSVEYIRTKNTLENNIEDAIMEYKHELVIQTDITSIDSDYIMNIVEEKYYANPAYALGMPTVTVTSYPEGGANRILEIGFTYEESQSVMAQIQTIAVIEAEDIVLNVTGLDGDYDKAIYLCQVLVGRAGQAPDEQADILHTGVYGPLCMFIGTDEGYAMAYNMLCDRAGIPCQVVRGLANNEEHYWNIVQIGDRYYHIDTYVCDTEGMEAGFMKTDEEMAAGYWWDSESYPACVGDSVSLEQ